ncbi:MAG: TraV family lipoprotein [Nitrospiria bacterium]
MPGTGGLGPVEENFLPAPETRHPIPVLPSPDHPIPVRSAPKILRVWVAPWIDDEGDLHQEGYLYLVVNHGRWLFGLPEMETGEIPDLGIIPEVRQEEGEEDHGE